VALAYEPSPYNASKPTAFDVIITDDIGELQICGAMLDSVNFVSKKPTLGASRLDRVFVPDQWAKIAMGMADECGVDRTPTYPRSRTSTLNNSGAL